MSVDTYLKGKNLQPYSAAQHEGVRVLVSPSLFRWAQAVQLHVKQFLLWKSFEVEALAKPHRHGPTCAH